ncbi:MAG: hypothetical protein Q7U55_04440 [Deltaproteobacteria bacterium]|nr:hypothetical protein [Deltaproteobacteria bacterium]
MKIVMMSRWNIPCGVSLHAELVGRAWVEMGHDLQVLAPVEWEDYQCDADEPYVKRCYRLPKSDRKEGYFFDQKPFVNMDCDVFIVQNLEILPMEDLLKIYPSIKDRTKTVFVVHEGKPPGEPKFYRFEWDAIVCFDERYKRFLRDIYPEEKIFIIPYPCHPIMHGDKMEARRRLGLPLDKKIIFNYGIGVYRHLHLLPTIKRVSLEYPLILLTMTHIPDWYDLFDAAKNIYPFIDLRKGDIPIKDLYTYLHAADALLIHKDSAEAVVVPSTAYLCLGAGGPILAYDTNFFETFDKEVIKYSELGAALKEVFEKSDRVKATLEAAEKFIMMNSSYKIAGRFIRLFESLFSKGNSISLPTEIGKAMKGPLSLSH